MYSIRPDYPLDAITQNIVRQFDDACRSLDIDYFRIGATARDIMLTHVFGVKTYRATRDVDFAVAVPDWQTFDLIKSWFLARPESWSSSTNTHRLLYRDNDTDAVVPMDVVPFGGSYTHLMMATLGAGPAAAATRNPRDHSLGA